MHRIVKAHLESFVASFSLEADEEAQPFEKFAPYSVISNRFCLTLYRFTLLVSNSTIPQNLKRFKAHAPRGLGNRRRQKHPSAKFQGG